MKIKFCLILIFHSLLSKSQVDTIVLEYTPSIIYEKKFTNGYFILKERGIIRQEFKFLNGKIDGLFKEYYDNGKIKLVANLKNLGLSDSFCGIYKEFYKSGILKTEGNYQYVDSVECINCFDYFNNVEQKMTYRQFIRRGLWSTFYENGQLESKGIYNGIHLTHYTDCEYPASKKSPIGIFCAGSESVEYLKDKEWEYFSTKGNLIKVEYYFRGVLAEIKTYTE